MLRIKPLLATLIIIICTGCDVNIAPESIPAATPAFVTATLPPTSVPQPTQTPIPPTAAPTLPPVEGTTTTQVNVRAETNTASESFGVILSFSPVQIVGKDDTGTWYRILYADSPVGTGWVRAEFVQVSASAEIQAIDLAAGFGSGVSGLVTSGINVRSGPGSNYESLGVLTPKDVVLVTGKDSGGTWVQILFSAAADGKGWVSSEFLQMKNSDSLPMIGAVESAQETPSSVTGTTAPSQKIALPDGDTLSSPLANGFLSPTGLRTLQVQGDISAPEGDNEDWIAFSFSGTNVAFRLSCELDALQVEVWYAGAPGDSFLLACAEERLLKIEPDQDYVLRLSEPATDDFRYTSYIFTIEAVH